MDWKYEKGRIFSTDEKGELMAEATYENLKDGCINIDHVYVNPVLRGQGIADKVMAEAVSFLRREGLKATATCSYANAWFKKNKDKCEDVIAKENENCDAACRIDGKH